jgi:hypothetical protein
MKPSDAAKTLHERIDWAALRDIREIDRLAARAIEVLKGIRRAEVEEFISSTTLHQIIHIQAGKNYSSRPSNISTALQRFGGALEKRHVDGCLKFRFPETPAAQKQAVPKHTREVDARLLALCERFHRATVHLTHRRKGRPAIDFSDEYDVQDVFGTVLKCTFEDVRDEEWTPSYAGHAARIDFVIRDVKTATELKRARPRQELADELIVDIARYAGNSEVEKLVCFVYDPDGLLRHDAVQIERDLSGPRTDKDSNIDVTVLIRPK